MITFTCSTCQKKFKVKDGLSSQRVKCPGCGQVVAVPAFVESPVPGSSSFPAERQDSPTSAGNERSEPPRHQDQPTQPPPSKPDATESPNPPDSRESSLTDFLAPPQADDELGRLGGFRILKVLGHGGMGVVFQGEDPKLGRKVAIKVMLPHLAESRTSQQRFLREAKAAAALEHDHIVPIYHVGEDRGAPFIVMPLLKGEALDRRLRRDERLPIAEVLRIGREIAKGLDAAHAIGLIHRDIKPANIWLETSGEPGASATGGRVKILDFGLARASAQESGLTQQGAIIGTPTYMAPEQGRGDNLDGRCDLWSLGVVLYRLCTGRVPFRGTDSVSTLLAVAMTDPPPPAQINAEVSAELSDLVMKLLEKDPARRIGSAREVVETLLVMENGPVGHVANVPGKKRTLESCPTLTLAGLGSNGRSTQTRRSRKPLLLALAGGLVAAVIVAIVMYWPRAEDTPNGPAVKNDPPAIPVADDADRRAAEWVLSIKGTVKINGKEPEIKAGGESPQGPYELTAVNLYRNPSVGDAALANLKDCKHLTFLDLTRTQVTDEGLILLRDCKKLVVLNWGGTRLKNAALAILKDYKNLKALDLGNTLVGDAGLAHLRDCKNLAWLDLGGTRLSDAGLAQLADCPKLDFVSLKKTKVTEAGVKKLSAALPGCKIEWDGGVIEPRTAVAPDRRAADWVLSIGGEVKIKENDDEHTIKAVDELPGGTFELTGANLRENPKVTDLGFAHFKDCKNLRSLDLFQTKVSDVGLAYFKDCKNLSGLCLRGTEVSDAGLAYFGDLKNLARLDLAFTNVSDVGLAYFKDCKNLTGLNISYSQVGESGLVHFKDCKFLTYLALDGTKVGDAGLVHFKDCQNLRDLGLSRTRVSNAGLAHFKHCNLTGLDLQNTDVSDAGLAHFKNCKDLTELWLSGTQVGDAGLGPFEDCKDLTDLRLARTRVGDAGLAHFRHCKKLTVLFLDDTQVSDEGLPRLAELKQVKQLSLAGNGVTDAGITHLTGLTNLDWLDLRRTKASAVAVAELQKALPKCKVDWDGPKDK